MFSYKTFVQTLGKCFPLKHTNPNISFEKNKIKINYILEIIRR